MKSFSRVAVLGLLGLSSLAGCVSATDTESETVGSASAEVNACYTNSGLNPTKAALAVAMADELGRWDPARDLQVIYGGGNFPGVYQVVVLHPAAVCLKNNCANTKALLGQQDPRSVVDQNVFNPWMYNSEVVASANRNTNYLSDLYRNNRSKMPPAHKLTLVGGPVDLGLGACGPHYVFQADKLDGTPLTATEAANLSNGMCFYGFGTCGNGNPYIKYTVTGQGCPAGRTCVAVDPADGDNGSTTTTTAGSAPVYPLNRVYDPTNSLLTSACTTTAGKVTKLISKCTTSPSTCGYLYCI
jgi:hypothetical protein